MITIDLEMIIRRLIILLFFINLGAFSQENSLQIQLEIIAENLVAPVAMACPNDGLDQIFIAEQKGLIYIIDHKKLIKTPFLDISKKLIKLFGIYDERGLLGLTFHPKFKENGRFFIYYSSNLKQKGNNHIAVLSEYKVDPSNPNRALIEEKIILQISEPEWNHNGGQLMFGQDGYLYLGLGDGGGAGDKHGTYGNAQNKSTLLGKILRLDVDSKSPYSIPSDNPFVGQTGRAEIYAYGLRNPWKFSQCLVLK
jgi:glucose/arabinose dehydrogenase